MSCETTFNTYQQSNPVKKCGSVTAKRAYLFQTKELIRQALNAKGLDVTTDDTFRSYAEYIMQIPNLNNTVTGIIDAEGEKHVGDVTIDKAFIGLDKVNNTTDLEKPISNATQAALDLKANNDATNIVTENWRAQLRINNVDNTPDIDKPVSTAVQTALDKKADKTDTLAGYGITDAKIEEGVITLGENTITPLTSTSLINGANVTGVVPEARKTTRDSDNNIISETYAKNVEVNTALNQKQNREDNSLVTPNKTITDAINDAWNYASKNNGDLNTTVAGTNSNIDFNTWGANLGIPEIKTSVDGKQDKLTAGAYIEISDANVISVSGIPEGAVTSVNNVSPDETGNVTIAAANISDVYSKTEVNTELGKKQDKLSFYKEDTSQTENFKVTIGNESVIDFIELNAEKVISLNAMGISGAAISTSIPASISSASDYILPSEKAVATALSQKADITSLNDYQTKAINITGLTDKTVEGALGTLNDTSTTLSSEISEIKNTDLPTKADKATTLSGYGITDAYTKDEVNTELGKKQDKLSYYSENTATNKASFNIDGKYTGKSEFSVNVSNSTSQSEGSVIDLSVGSNRDLIGRLNLSAYGASGGKILLSTSHAAYPNSGIELNAPLPPDSDGVGENSGIVFNGPISGTGITKTITDVDYQLPTSKAVKTELDKKQNKLSYYTEDTTSATTTVSLNPDPNGIADITVASNGGITLNGHLIGTAIVSSDISVVSEASDTLVTSEKSVAKALASKANKATTLSGYGITDAKIESGIITLGNNTITPLTPTSSIPANLIAGTVDSADKAINDADGNPISTTYAKSTDVNAGLALKQNITDNTLATTAKTIPAAINEVNSTLSSKQDVSNLVTAFSATTSDTKYPSEKLVYSSLGTLSQSITSLENDTQALSNNKANKATTLAGYNIGDAYTKDDVDTKLNLKQDKTDDSLNTTSKTIVGGINELFTNKQNNLTTYTESETSATLTSDSIILNGALSGSGISSTISGNADSDKSKIPTVAAVYDSIQSLKVTSTVNTTVTPEAIEAATAITNALAKPARVVVNPNIANTGAVYIQESDTYTPINPIYPDPTNNVYEFVNMQNVKVFIDSLGDSVDLRIEYRG